MSQQCYIAFTENSKLYIFSDELKYLGTTNTKLGLVSNALLLENETRLLLINIEGSFSTDFERVKLNRQTSYEEAFEFKFGQLVYL